MAYCTICLPPDVTRKQLQKLTKRKVTKEFWEDKHISQTFYDYCIDDGPPTCPTDNFNPQFENKLEREYVLNTFVNAFQLIQKNERTSDYTFPPQFPSNLLYDMLEILPMKDFFRSEICEAETDKMRVINICSHEFRRSLMDMMHESKKRWKKIK